ncbi:MAG: type III-A CRISPR-associated protein Cas10/Csm1 [Deltaproteobacteria bacterium]|nr:type III-A CRISPR-associated protein Cas10/Csm1 [Deltaproteobacteria bacterium]
MYNYFYPVRALSPRNIFPNKKSEPWPIAADQAKSEYKILFDQFSVELKGLLHINENPELWFHHFDSLMMIYTTSIPTDRSGAGVPDISLYDHLKTTAALAAALYLYHQANNSLSIESIKKKDDKKFLIIGADFYGIQDFIFKGFGDTREFRSKFLRGRSFAVSLLTELAADLVCQKLGLPFSSVLFNAAGKFTIIAANTREAQNAVQDAEKTINTWLIHETHGENSIGLATLEAAPENFLDGKFVNLWEELGARMERKKYTRFNLAEHGGVVETYLGRFDNTLRPHSLCPFCGKRPSIARPLSDNTKGTPACGLCHDHIFLGTNLVKKNWIAITNEDKASGPKYGELTVPIFGTYQLFFTDGDLGNLPKSGSLLRLWDVSIPTERKPEDKSSQRISVRYINGYVPTFSKYDEEDRRYGDPAKSDNKSIELRSQIIEGDPKTFSHLALLAKIPTDKENEFRGVEALGILKADVDNLGMHMTCGLPEDRLSISRMSTLSRRLDLFFSLYLPYELSQNPKFNNIYTVFAGGDDLFLIGPWNRIFDLACFLKDRWAEYVCHNDRITFSAGISLHKPHTPVTRLAEASEEALEASKDKGRDRLTVFAETVKWNKLGELTKIKEEFSSWLGANLINNAMLYRLNGLIELAKEEEIVVKQDKLDLSRLNCLKWRAYLYYTVARNAAKELKGDDRTKKVEEITLQLAQWLDRHKGKMIIPLWQILYEVRANPLRNKIGG